MLIALIRPISLSSSKAKEKALRASDCEVFLETVHSHQAKASNGLKSLPYMEGDAITAKRSKQPIIDFISQKIYSRSNAVPGLKVKKVILAEVPKVQDGGEVLKLYVVPLTAKHDIAFRDEDAGFFALSTVLNESVMRQNVCTEESFHALEGLDRWLKRQILRPFGWKALFRSSALERIHENITNPAYSAKTNRESWLLLENSLTPDEAMERMKEKNKVDLHITNPLFGTDLHPYSKVDFLVVNTFFGQKAPDYSKIKIPDGDDWFKGQDSTDENQELSWVEEFPAHRAAADGDVAVLSQFLQSDASRLEVWDHDGWSPAHYACWYGRLDAMKLLLNQGSCDPNMRNRNQTSLLHLAAGCGNASIVKLLCEHPFIDRHVVDKQGRSAAECCEQVRSKDWHKCMQYVKELSHKSYQKLIVHRMDGSEKSVELRNGSNTRVVDVMNSLNFSNEAKMYFALWITSKSLHLQLKPEHRPLIEIEKWPEILRQLSGIHVDACQDEKPTIVLKRDVRLFPNIEEEVTDIVSIRLLYEEAHIQVLRGLYPCSDQVAVAMAAVVMRILHGPYDAKKHKPGYFSDEVLRQLIPVCKLRMRSVGWVSKIMVKYKEISEQGPGEISQLQLLYLRYCWTQIPPYGSAFFTGYVYATKQEGGEKYQQIVPLYIGCNHRGVHFIKVESKLLLVSVSYHSLKWHLNEEKRMFQIRTEDDKVNMIIHTPQAALICSLMTKLTQAANPLAT